MSATAELDRPAELVMPDMPPIVFRSTSDEIIAEMREKVRGLTIGENDDEKSKSYALVKDSLRAIVSMRVAVEKERKELKQAALDYGRAVDAEAARITSEFADMEKPLAAEKKRVDEKKERLKREAEEAARKAEEERLAEIARREKAIKDAEDAKRREEQAKIDAERAELERQKKELADAQAAIKAQQDAIDAAKREQERQAELEKARKEAAEQAERDLAAKLERDKADAERRRAEEEQRAAFEKARIEEMKPDVAKLQDMATSLEEFWQIKPNIKSKAAKTALAQANTNVIQAINTLRAFQAK